MRRRVAVLAAIALSVAACGDSDEPTAAQADPALSQPIVLRNADAPVPASLRGVEAAAFRAGRSQTARSGCLACHQIGRAGNDGPGPELSDIGKRLAPAALLRTLRDSTAPMPSYRSLGRARLDDLVTFLTALDGPTGLPPRPAADSYPVITGINCRDVGDECRRAIRAQCERVLRGQDAPERAIERTCRLP